jgi:hypothetical protein
VLGRVLAAAALAATGVLAFGPVAQASVAGLAQRTASFDDRVETIVIRGGTVYLGGRFTHATDLSGRQVVRNHLAAVDGTTGDLLPWDPGANRTVYALAVAGTTVYAGGDFSTVGGVVRNRLAALDAASGAVLAWNHRADGRVRALDASPTRLYAGGQFTSVDGASRSRLAAFSLAGGNLDGAWTPAADDTVFAVRVSPAADRVYVGGSFPTLDGAANHGYFGAVDPASGDLDGAFHGRIRYKVGDIAATADGVYAAGDGSGGHLVAFRPDGSLKFPTVQTDGGAQAVAVLDGEVYVGGHWDNVCLTGNVTGGTGGGFVCSGPQATRHKLLSVDEQSGAVTDWNPGADSPLGVFALAATPATGTLEAGGDFTRVHQQSHPHFAQFG